MFGFSLMSLAKTTNGLLLSNSTFSHKLQHLQTFNPSGQMMSTTYCFIQYFEINFLKRLPTTTRTEIHASRILDDVPWSNTLWTGLTPFGPLLWQAEADTELTFSASRCSGPKGVIPRYTVVVNYKNIKR